jgi:NADH-quinone oxidoreductase subunit M
VGLIVFLGIYPKPVLDRMQPAVDALVVHVEDNSDFVSPEVDQPVVADDDEQSEEAHP